MILLGHHILSPLGDGTEANWHAILAGKTAMRLYENRFASVEPFYASLFENQEPRAKNQELGAKNQEPRTKLVPTCRENQEQGQYSLFVSLCIYSAQEAIAQAGINTRSERVLFILSTTKGDNLDLLTPAQTIARHFGNPNPPIVVSNACTSGVSAQVVALRLVQAGEYDSIVLIGCDLQSQFIVSGFQSFKALSAAPCRPFDKDRCGLNVGEAVATMVVGNYELGIRNKEPRTRNQEQRHWVLEAGSIHNDANHISGPSRTGEGCFRCLEDVMIVDSGQWVESSEQARSINGAAWRPHLLDYRGRDARVPSNSDNGEYPMLVSVHGTATPYNDEMEAIALHRAGLDEMPIMALKGYYGHTMGAAGVLETILALRAAEEGIVPACKGYHECGTTCPLPIYAENKPLAPTDEPSVIKMLSGFGGCNAAVKWKRKDNFQIFMRNIVAGGDACVPGHNFQISKFSNFQIKIDSSCELTALYRKYVGNYPKFFKMDTLARLGFVGVEMLLRECKGQHLPIPQNPALVFGNRSASIKNDTDYLATITNPEQYFPSPALFVYTLPNIVTGEIAIRHKWYGETCFYVLPEEDQLLRLAEITLRTTAHDSAIVGWVECTADNNYFAHIQLLWKN
ncbi:MAG: beta-ketoacyl synthase N-terminal-like domain-containing protein [Paludibacteraceae bacterium]